MQIACKMYFFPDQRTPLHSTLISCGHERVTESGYSHHGLKRGSGEFTIWQYTLAGRGAIKLAGKRSDLLPGQAFLVNVPSDHMYYLPEDSTSWEFIFLSLFGYEIRHLADVAIAQYGNILNISPASPVIKLAWAQIQGHREKELNKFDISGVAYQFMLAILSELEYSPQRSTAHQLLKKINDFLSQHIDEPLTVSRLAEEVGLSRYYFSTLFHQVSGETPQHYLAAARLKFAIQLLQTNAYSIKEVAAHSGFTDSSYFCRAFRKAYGVSPETYRKRRQI